MEGETENKIKNKKEIYKQSVDNGVILGTAIYQDIINFWDKFINLFKFKKKEVQNENRIDEW